MTDWAETRKILEVGARAISPYNVQPWRFRPRDGGVDIYIIRTKNFFLKLRGVSAMTLGFLLENLSEGARAAGRRMETEILGFHLNLDRPMARVRFLSDPGAPADIAAVLARRTNRYPYDPAPLGGPVRTAVEALFAGLSDGSCGARLLEGETKLTLAHILGDLETVRLSNVKLLAEAIEFIRFAPEENRASRDRLDLLTLALTPREERALRLFRRYPFLRRALSWAMSRPAGGQRRRLFHACAGIALFTVADEDYRSYIELGRRVQRCLNALAALGLDAQPILSGLYLLHLIFENPEIFSAKEKDTLLTCHRDIELLTGVQDRRIAFLVRLGKADRTAPEALRKDLDSLVLS